MQHISGGCTRSTRCTSDTRSSARHLTADLENTGLCRRVYEVYEGYEVYRGDKRFSTKNQTHFWEVYKVHEVYEGYETIS